MFDNRRSLVLTALLSFAGCGGSQTPPDGGVDAGLSGCPPLSGNEVTHGKDITSSETWAGDGTVHRMTFHINVRPGATLTLEPCALVKVMGSYQLTIVGGPQLDGGSQPAKLVARGTAERPVLLTDASDGGAKWGGIRAMNGESTVELSYTTLENAGQSAVYGTALNVRGGSTTPWLQAVPVLKADHLTIRNASGTGLYFESGGAFTADSTDITITGGGTAVNGGYAIEMNTMALGTLPTLTLTGNAQNAVRASGSLYISRDLTLKNRGVPYYFFFDRVRVTDETGLTTPTLTIEPGVELRFDDYLIVGFDGTSGTPMVRPGRLTAVGTTAAPIVFTSSKATRAAGDWPGVYLRNAPGSRLENVRIEYAGDFNGIVSANCRPSGSNDNAALFIGSRDFPYLPAASDFSNVAIVSSAAHGINAMWSAASFGPDLTAGFTFQSVVGCRQTKNNRTTGCGTEAGCLVP